MAERAYGGHIRGPALAAQIAGRLVRNPIVIALVVGLGFSLLGVRVPGFIGEPVNLLAASSVAVSLFVIGGTLSGLTLRAIDARLVPVVVGKLLLHPLAVWMALAIAASVGFVLSDQSLAHAMVLMAAMPTMGIYPILAQRYGQQNSAALAMFVMTGVSFFSISAFLWLLESAPPV